MTAIIIYILIMTTLGIAVYLTDKSYKDRNDTRAFLTAFINFFLKMTFIVFSFVGILALLLYIISIAISSLQNGG